MRGCGGGFGSDGFGDFGSRAAVGSEHESGGAEGERGAAESGGDPACMLSFGASSPSVSSAVCRCAWGVGDAAIVGEVDFRARGWVGIEEHGWNDESTRGGEIVSGSGSNWVRKQCWWRLLVR